MNDQQLGLDKFRGLRTSLIIAKQRVRAGAGISGPASKPHTATADLNHKLYDFLPCRKCEKLADCPVRLLSPCNQRRALAGDKRYPLPDYCPAAVA